MKRLEDGKGASQMIGVRLPQTTYDRIDALIDQTGASPFGAPSRVSVVRAAIEEGLIVLARMEGIILPGKEDAMGARQAPKKKKPTAGKIHPNSAARAAKRAAERLAAGCTCGTNHTKTCSLYRRGSSVVAGS